ncbi:MAG: DUF4040 domain-containing protein [Candidatus Diapherotrites archaeon]|nr:DUF4040 domain-containing protein [Candidatus Diapherotrites archaeon]
MIFLLVQIFALIVIIISALAAIYSKDLLAAVVSLAVMSLVLSLEFYLLQAPDVAMAEASVGAALTTAIFVLAISKTRRYEQ